MNRWSGFGAGALLVLFALVAYWPTLSCGFIWDDDDYVEHNKVLEAPAGLVRIWTEPTASPQYYPLVFTTFWIERRLYDLDPAGYHAVNVLLHAANGLLLWRLLRRLAIPVAWFAAALFVLHPVEVESVAWITERKNVLSGFLYLASALAYLRFRPPDRETTDWRWYAASLGLFVLALLSKTVTCSLPAALLLVTWWKRPRLGWRDLGPLAPMFVVGAALAGVTVWMERHHVGATGIDFALTPADRILIAGRAVCFYLGKLIWPVDLAFIYARWTIDPTSAEQWTYPIAVALLLAAAWFGRRIVGKGPLVALLFFVGTLLPALGFIDVYPMKFSFVADHFQYLASIGPLTLFAVAGKRGLELLFAKRPGMPALIGAAWLMALGVLTWAQVSIYVDRTELWTDTLRKDPDSWIGHQNLAEELFQKRKLDPDNLAEARKHYQEAACGSGPASGRRSTAWGGPTGTTSNMIPPERSRTSRPRSGSSPIRRRLTSISAASCRRRARRNRRSSSTNRQSRFDRRTWMRSTTSASLSPRSSASPRRSRTSRPRSGLSRTIRGRSSVWRWPTARSASRTRRGKLSGVWSNAIRKSRGFERRSIR